MYRIVGADGKVYGPIDLEQLQQWAAQGRVNPQTRIQPEGTAEWKPATEVPEVQAALAAAGFGPALAPPPQPVGPAAGAARETTLAITSFVLGIVSVVLLCLGPLLGIPAIICGHIAHSRTRRAPAQYGGGGFAIAGFVLGYVGLALSLLVLPAMLLPALSQAKARAQSINCANNLKQVGIAFKVWALDHNDRFPFNVSTNSGGTLELCARGADGYDRNAALHFMAMSNEISAPLILVCPAARDKSSGGKSPAFNFQNLQSANVTYLLRTGPAINPTNPAAVLAVCPVCGNVLLVDGSVQQRPNVRPKPAPLARPGH
jgi:competence protein ComGC